MAQETKIFCQRVLELQQNLISTQGFPFKGIKTKNSTQEVGYIHRFKARALNELP